VPRRRTVDLTPEQALALTEAYRVCRRAWEGLLGLSMSKDTLAQACLEARGDADRLRGLRAALEARDADLAEADARVASAEAQLLALRVDAGEAPGF